MLLDWGNLVCRYRYYRTRGTYCVHIISLGELIISIRGAAARRRAAGLGGPQGNIIIIIK